MPRTKKAPGAAADRRNGRREVVAGEALEVALPRPRDTYHPIALVVWDGYWSDVVASTVTTADLMVVFAWISAYDDALVKQAEADKVPLVDGSQDNLVANPLYAVAKASMDLAMACARQLGIGAKNRADLGISLLSERSALDDLNARYTDWDEDGEDDGDDDDPRLATGR